MPRTANRLTARGVAAASEPGRYADGAGLSLVVSKAGSRQWVLRFTVDKRTRDLGLGSAASVTLAEARQAAEAARALLRQGIDPIDHRAAEARASVKAATFRDVMDQLFASISGGFRNPKHSAQWRNTLEAYAAPLMSTPVDQIATDDVLWCLQPIWLAKAETARRVRGRIERVIDAATARGLRSGPNPAAWRNHLALLLPKGPKLTRGHHAAMPYPEVPDLVGRLRAVGSVSARALEFTILCAARSGETLGARWREVDFDRAIWTVPATRMKGGREHIVPLSPRAMVILAGLRALNHDDNPDRHVFPGARQGRGLSVMAMDMALRRLKVDVTTHGFRSSFRDWAGDATSFPRELAEMALSHQVGNAVENAYRRGSAVERRRAMMLAWAEHCEPRPANVVALPRRA